MKGLKEIDESQKAVQPVVRKPDVIVDPNSKRTKMTQSGGNVGKALDIIGDNFDSIVDLAKDIVSIRKMKVQTKATLELMESRRKDLEAETDAYIRRKREERDDKQFQLDKLHVLESMMANYNASPNSQLSGEDFYKIMSEIINKIDLPSNGNK